MTQGAETVAIFNKRAEISQQLEQIRRELFASIQGSIPIYTLFHDLKLRDTLNTRPDVGLLFTAIEAISQQYPDSVQKLTTKVLNFLLPPERRGLDPQLKKETNSQWGKIKAKVKNLIPKDVPDNKQVRIRSNIELSRQQLTEITFGLELPYFPIENNKVYLRINFNELTIGWQFLTWAEDRWTVIPKDCPVEEQLAVANCLMQGTWAVIKPGI